jgi:branched-chain amino acid transport system substrate-binding protein
MILTGAANPRERTRMRNLLMAATALVAMMTTAMAAGPVRGVTDTEIIIGSHTDLSGVTVAWGVNNSNAYRMAFDEINAKGGIHGRKIRYIVEDNQYQVPRAVQAANKLLNRDNVFLLVANDGTPMNNAVLPEQLEKNVPNMFPLTSARSMYEPYNRLKFGLLSSYYDQMRAGVKYFVEQRGKKTLCTMAQDSDFGRDNMDGVHDQVKAMGLKLAAETLHKPTDTDFSASVARLRDAKCDLVLMGSIVRDTTLIISAVRKIGWDVDLMGAVASYDSAVAEVPGGANDGYYAMTAAQFAYPDDPRPAVGDFARKYKTLYGRDPNFAAQIGDTGARLLIQALQNAGRELNVDSFVAGMEAIRDYRDAFAPPLNYGPKVRVGSTSSFLAQVKGGRWTLAAPDAIGY